MILLGDGCSVLVPRLPTSVRCGTRPFGPFWLVCWAVPSRGYREYCECVVVAEGSGRLQVDAWVEMRKVITGPLP
ncbi:MAG: hypothetical protein EOP24_43300, partial [Hyphomicrobiales bacterium]